MFFLPDYIISKPNRKDGDAVITLSFQRNKSAKSSTYNMTSKAVVNAIASTCYAS